MLSLTSPSQKPGGSYPSHGGYLDRLLELKWKTGIQGCSKEGVWSRPNGNFHACYFRVPWKRWFYLHETTLSQEGSICHCNRFSQLEASAGHRPQKTHLAGEWRKFILEIRNESGRGGLFRYPARARLHTFFSVFSKVGVSRARDECFREQEIIGNARRRKVSVSRRRNTFF